MNAAELARRTTTDTANLQTFAVYKEGVKKK